jgi:uncharacterized protein YfdQ (DUF2303 family)
MPTSDERTIRADDALPTWAHALVEAIQLPREVQHLKIGEQYAAIVPNGATVETVGPGTEFDRERAGLPPVRPSGNPYFSNTDSFIAYVNKHNIPGETEIYADQERRQIVAVFDWHGQYGSNWGVHRATLRFQPDPDWQAWMKVDRRAMSQQDFAEFLEDQREDIVSPSAATVMEACANLEVTTSASFQSRIRLSDGTAAFSYSEDQRTGQVKIPQEIKLKLSPFTGLPSFQVDARIRTSIKDQKLTFKVLLDRPHKVIEQAVNEEVLRINKDTDIVVFYGIPSNPLI